METGKRIAWTSPDAVVLQPGQRVFVGDVIMTQLKYPHLRTAVLTLTTEEQCREVEVTIPDYPVGQWRIIRGAPATPQTTGATNANH